jgi:hypothetical protein
MRINKPHEEPEQIRALPFAEIARMGTKGYIFSGIGGGEQIEIQSISAGS